MTGSVAGSVLGSLVWIMFPGLDLSAAAGGPIASKLTGDIDQRFAQKVGAAIKPGNSALFLVIGEADRVAVQAMLEPFQGTVYTTSLPDKFAQELNRSSGDRE